MDNTIVVALVSGGAAFLGTLAGNIFMAISESNRRKQERKLKLLETYNSEQMSAHRNFIDKCSRFITLDRKLASSMTSGEQASVDNEVLYESYEHLLSAAHSAVLVSNTNIGELINDVISHIQLDEQYFFFTDFDKFEKSYSEYLKAFASEYRDILNTLGKSIK